MIPAALLLIALAGVVVIAIGAPFLRPSAALDVGTQEEQARRELLERRDATLAALQELEQDRAAGRLTQADFEQERLALRAEAVVLLRRLDGETFEREDAV